MVALLLLLLLLYFLVELDLLVRYLNRSGGSSKAGAGAKNTKLEREAALEKWVANAVL